MNSIDGKRKLVIIGAGPRGLSTALYASLKESLEITIIDPAPIHTWRPPYIIQDIVMRSPISFDLTTYVEELQLYSLSKFLRKPYKFTDSQKWVEQNPIQVTREEFSQYLEYIYNTIVHLLKIKFIYEDVVGISETDIRTRSYKIPYDNLVLACGSRYTQEKVAYWIKETQLKDKLVSAVEIIKYVPEGQRIAVVGSGQGAAELVYYLAKNNNKLYWCLNKKYKVDQYPAPSYKKWGFKSALSGYYRSIKSEEKRQEYIKEVKEWQPSITPYIAQKIQEIEDKIEIINPDSSRELEEIYEKAEKVISVSGKVPDVSLIPFEFEIDRQEGTTNFPKLEEGFKSTSHPRIAFTGLMASMFDGPRQGSLISAALTSREIIEGLKD